MWILSSVLIITNYLQINIPEKEVVSTGVSGPTCVPGKAPNQRRNEWMDNWTGRISGMEDRGILIACRKRFNSSPPFIVPIKTNVIEISIRNKKIHWHTAMDSPTEVSKRLNQGSCIKLCSSVSLLVQAESKRLSDYFFLILTDQIAWMSNLTFQMNVWGSWHHSTF